MNEFEEKLLNEMQRIRIILSEWSGVQFEEEGEKSDATSGELGGISEQIPHDARADSKPKIRIHSPGFDDYVEPKPLPKVVETQNFIDVRECINYSEKSYKLIGFDNRYCFPAKQHISSVVRDKGLTTVIFKADCVWAKDSLEWK